MLTSVMANINIITSITFSF